jgi:hypothetical protein
MKKRTKSTRSQHGQRGDLYKQAMSEDEVRRLNRVALFRGSLRAEIDTLRIVLQRLLDEKLYDEALKVTTAIARLEEAASRIRGREPDAERDMSDTLALCEGFFEQLAAPVINGQANGG